MDVGLAPNPNHVKSLCSLLLYFLVSLCVCDSVSAACTRSRFLTLQRWEVDYNIRGGGFGSDETRFRTLISVSESQIFRTLYVAGGGAEDLKSGYLRHITNR